MFEWLDDHPNGDGIRGLLNQSIRSPILASEVEKEVTHRRITEPLRIEAHRILI